MTNDQNIMEWDDTIEQDGEGYRILPAGDYSFTVAAFERGRFPGSERMPACNKAMLTLKIDGMDGMFVRDSLILHRSLEWKLAAFFRCIGLKQRGEKMVMDWSRVQGTHGRARIRPQVRSRDGKERTFNEVERYLEPVTVFTEVNDPHMPWTEEEEEPVCDACRIGN